MKKFNLKRLLRKQPVASILEAVTVMAEDSVSVWTEDGELLVGANAPDTRKIALELDGIACGWVGGNGPDAERIASLITYLMQREQEKVALAQDSLEHYSEINLLYRIGERIFSCLDPAEISRLVISELKRFVKTDRISVLLFNDETKTLEVLAASDTESITMGLPIFVEGIVGSVMASGKAEIINNIRADARYTHDPNSIGSLMCVPLNAKASCLGIISLSRDQVMDFSARDLRLTTAIASQTAIAIENAQLYDELLEHNKTLEQKVAERTNELNASLIKVNVANRLIRQTFGRYLSEDVVDGILSSPEGAALGGESRMVTIMMTDLRGFTPISERLSAKAVLGIVNLYLERMTEVIMQHNGTIIEFIGDAILAVFGAPVLRGDDAKRAVACAVEMQLAMADVNARCRELGYPEVEQGIGINTGECVVGNIGSDKRTKYGLVGANVNLTGRIESYSVGGQILISESTARACSPLLRIHNPLDVMPKGLKEPIHLFDVSGIGGDYNVFLPSKAMLELIEPKNKLPINFVVLEGKHATKETHDGAVIALNAKECLIQSDTLPEPLANVKLTLNADGDFKEAFDLYAKVIESPSGNTTSFKVYFTSVPLEAKNLLEELCSTAV